MIKTFTKNEWVKYLYKETSKDEKWEMEQVRLTEPQLEEEITGMESVLYQLDKLSLSPPTSVRENILNYSRNFKKE